MSRSCVCPEPAIFKSLEVCNNAKINGNLSVDGRLKACEAYIAELIANNVKIKGQLTWKSDDVINCGVTFQLVDGYGYTVDGTEFTVPLKIVKRGNEVSLYFPEINFQIGQTSTEDPSGNTTPSTGYLRTTSNYLPKEFSPTTLSYQTAIAGSGRNLIVPWSNSNTLFVGSIEAPIYQGYVAPTVFQGYIEAVGYVITVTSIISGPGLFIGSTILGAGIPATLLPPGTTIVSFEPYGPGTYGLNTNTGPFGSLANPITLTTQSLLTITEIIQGATPIVGTIINASGLVQDIAVTSSALVDADGTTTGSYFLNTTTAATTDQPNPVTITADLLNVLSVTNFFGGNPIRPSMIVYGQGVAPGTVIIAYASGTGQTGTYIVNINQTFASTQLEGSNPPGTFALQPLNDISYQLRVGPRGDIAIQGRYGLNINASLPSGMHAILPTSMSYLSVKQHTLKNFVINADQSNITQWPNYQEFTPYGGFGSAYRDTQVCSILNDTAVFVFASNGNQINAPPQPGLANFVGGIVGTTLTVSVINYGFINPGAILTGLGLAPATTVSSANLDGTYTVSPSQSVLAGTTITATTGPGQQNGVSDVSISLGAVSSNGGFTPNPGYPTYLTNNGTNITNSDLLASLPNYAQNLTTNPPTYCPVFVFNTASTINPTNPNNIVVSWGLGNIPTYRMAAVTFDGGITWSYNGPINVQPSGGLGAGRQPRCYLR